MTSDTRPLRIGLLTPALAGVTGLDSGIGAHFRHLADALSTAGHRVCVLLVTENAIRSDGALPFEVRPVRVARPLSARLAGRFSWQCNQWLCVRAAIRAAARAARPIPVDVWETTSTGSLARDFLAQRARAPVVTRVSTTAAQLRTTNAGPARWISRRLEAWERAAVRRSDRVLTHSRSHREAVAAEFGLAPDSIRIIPHGIPIPADVSRVPSGERCRILYVGRLEHRKGIDLLLAALPAVLREVPGATATIVGADRDDHWHGQWRNSAPPDLRGRVAFTGVVDAATLATLYGESDLFVAPSRYESFGLIFVEAMARALPVVALRAPGAIDLVEEDVTGRLAAPEDPAALAAVLTGLGRDAAARARLGAAARRTAATSYSLDALASASVEFYREAIRTHRG